MILDKFTSYFYLEAMDRHIIKYNDIFYPASTKMKKFRKGNNKKKSK